MGMKAVKFGGTSLCSAAQMKKAAEIVLADADRRVVVVSAPGKRSPEDEKITDLLYRCYEEADDVKKACLFEKIRERFDGIISDLGLSLDLSEEYEAIQNAGVKFGGRDYFVSRGEYLCAKIFAALLKYEFLDAADGIFFHEDGSFDGRKTRTVLSALLAQREAVVIPGFYGRMPNDTIKTFPRGGSDITGAVAADAAGAYLYENFTDVSGFLLADPKIVDKPETVSIISYKELRRLSYMGASVLHEDAVFPVRRSGIPINIRNTDCPDDPGTMIVEKKKTGAGISGIAGKKGYSLIRVSKDRIGVDSAAVQSLLGIFERRQMAAYADARSVDSVGILVESRNIAGKKDYILNEICQCLEPDTIGLSEEIALVCVVGEQMPPSVPAAVFCALEELGERIRFIGFGADDIVLTVGIREQAFERAVRKIYEKIGMQKIKKSAAP